MTYSAGNEQLNSIAYEYDLNGNRIRKTEGGVVTNYTYDDENRLRQVTQGSTTITYTYDPFGRRIEKNINGTVRQYLYDNEDIILECATTGTVLARYTHGPGIDEPLAVQQGTALYYYHADGLGSIAGLSNASGSVVQRYNYDSFGKFTQSGSVTQPYLFTAREYDTETGLYYYRARYYDPKAGRFITRDPIGFKGGINQYAYVDNNPVNRIDPLGLWENYDPFPSNPYNPINWPWPKQPAKCIKCDWDKFSSCMLTPPQPVMAMSCAGCLLGCAFSRGGVCLQNPACWGCAITYAIKTEECVSKHCKTVQDNCGTCE